MALVLSVYVCFIHRTYVQHIVVAIYSALAVNNDIDVCFLLS
jgi:hypothetical protein